MAAAVVTGGIVTPPQGAVGAATDVRDLSEVSQAPSSAAETMLPTTGPVDAGAGPQLNGASGSSQPAMTDVSLQSEGAAGSAQPLPGDIRPQPALVGMNAQPVGGGVSIQPDRADMRPQGAWAGAVGSAPPATTWRRIRNSIWRPPARIPSLRRSSCSHSSRPREQTEIQLAQTRRPRASRPPPLPRIAHRSTSSS